MQRNKQSDMVRRDRGKSKKRVRWKIKWYINTDYKLI